MALKPTIFKFDITVSDFDRDQYHTQQFTVAQHPSESSERMMVRVLAFCICAEEGLSFTAGLSTPDEPDICLRSLDDQLLLWLDVGEPGFDRLKKATRKSKQVRVFSFNKKSDSWWNLEQKNLETLSMEVKQFPWENIQALAALITRNMAFALTISEEHLYITHESSNIDFPIVTLQNR